MMSMNAIHLKAKLDQAVRIGAAFDPKRKFELWSILSIEISDSFSGG